MMTRQTHKEKSSNKFLKYKLLSLVAPDTVVIFATHDPNVFKQVDIIIDVTQI